MILVATRSQAKLREIREILSPLPEVHLIDLTAAGVAPDPEEDALECFETFEENARAKAEYFCRRTGLPVIADDSGLCVDALGGAPGVYSKRFSGREDLTGSELDRANNEHLLAALREVPVEERTAHYLCALAIVTPEQEQRVVLGRLDGVILQEPRGEGGFGYDPLFFVPELGASLGEVEPAVKNRLSHRAAAVRAALPHLRTVMERQEPGTRTTSAPLSDR